MQIDTVRLRWLNVQSYEIQLQNGKHILFDPQLSSPLPGDEAAKYYRIPDEYALTRDSIDRLDYMIINHTHCDHIIDFKYLAEKHKPLIICPETVAYELARAFDVPFTSFYPVGAGETHEFPEFTLSTLHGCHMPQPFTYSNMPNILETSYGVSGTGTMELGHLGGLYALNYTLTLDTNLRIGFFAGRMDLPSYPAMQEMKKYHPNVLIRQIPVRLPENPAELFAEELLQTGAQVMLPMHHESFEIDAARHDFAEKMFDEINERVRAAGGIGRVFRPERGKWYSVGVGLRE